LNFNYELKRKNSTTEYTESHGGRKSFRTKTSVKLRVLCGLFLLFFFNNSAIAQDNHLAAFSDPTRIWGNGIESVIESAYRQFFITRIIGDRVMNIRMPFAMNGERDFMVKDNWEIFMDGKGSPDKIWAAIEEILDSKEFEEYINALSSGREKVIIFEMNERKWSLQTDLFVIARIKSGAFKGLPHRPYVLTSGNGALESDVYNYLLCVGYIGLDCSGFVWHILDYIGNKGGINLGRVLSPTLGVPRGSEPARFVGTAFFGSRSPQLIQVNDEIRNLRPADVLLFRDIDGTIVHSAIIQSIDFTKGVIRYLQCTNVAPVFERGAHESFIHFDPLNTAVSLKDPSLHWTQRRAPPFVGEDIPFSGDGEIFRYKLNGGKVVRLKALEPVIERLSR